ncbi:aspartyl-phosphate phosphatase Spo0E family protein [Paenibacillus sp. N4]|jgi:low affinity Fe/Cu permease|uniref:aspartyl-phosphate phosphatase Spo0E family protein n=1 Tax=Paenibacillus vietnamensis TaxID=2590547 RepID=UPI001CD14E83|nr:aspartyl-phosphate phosphatase Spo0E family protein [Paenibacillus vietnamensis]MCA0754481.1 aspartyl-phosphate phosphatase Spo0E family protein [Paenibacillus vietnamensis]
MDKQLLIQMEQLRSKMVEMAALKQNLLHRDVILLSQSLDEIIVQVQRERLALSRVN